MQDYRYNHQKIETIAGLHREIARLGYFRALPFFEGEVDGESKKCANLFRAVLDRAILDCVAPNSKIRNSAFKFFKKTNPHFEYICDYSLLDPDYVLGEVLKTIKKLRKEIYVKYKDPFILSRP